MVQRVLSVTNRAAPWPRLLRDAHNVAVMPADTKHVSYRNVVAIDVYTYRQALCESHPVELPEFTFGKGPPPVGLSARDAAPDGSLT